jgi:hypothetical protein
MPAQMVEKKRNVDRISDRELKHGWTAIDEGVPARSNGLS